MIAGDPRRRADFAFPTLLRHPLFPKPTSTVCRNACLFSPPYCDPKPNKPFFSRLLHSMPALNAQQMAEVEIPHGVRHLLRILDRLRNALKARSAAPFGDAVLQDCTISSARASAFVLSLALRLQANTVNDQNERQKTLRSIIPKYCSPDKITWRGAEMLEHAGVGGLIGFPSCGLYQYFRKYLRWQSASRKAGYWSFLGGGALQNMRSHQRRPKREQMLQSYFGLSRLCARNIGTLHHHVKLRMGSGQTNDKRRGWLRDQSCKRRVGTVGNSLDELNDLCFFIEKSIYWGNAGRLGVTSR